jgi:hypothetical protein
VEHRADDARGYSTTQTAVEDQGFERSRADGRTRGLQLHEEEGAAVDGTRHSRVPVYGRRRHVEDAR